MNDSKKINITFKISSIKTLKFFIDNIDEIRQIDRKSFHFNITLGTLINPQTKLIGFDVIQVVYLDKELTRKVGELNSRIEFEIINFEEVVQHNEKIKEIKVPDQVMTTLISISLSTARGIFASKVEGSALEGVYMPIVNPSTFKKPPVHSDIEVKKKQKI